MTTSQRLFEAAKPIWEGYYTHPFVTGIGDGTLDMEKFRYFLLQDYIYLLDYAKVFAIGVTRAQVPELMRFFSQNVDAILNGELAIHRKYMADLGISEQEADSVKPALPNSSYTSYMLAVAHQQGVAEIIATILACSWSYREIGQRLALVDGALTHPVYGTWVSGYAGEEYDKTNAALVARMDDLAKDYTEEQYQNLEEIFLTCSRHEAKFWDMSWNLER